MMDELMDLGLFSLTVEDLEELVSVSDVSKLTHPDILPF